MLLHPLVWSNTAIVSPLGPSQLCPLLAGCHSTCTGSAASPAIGACRVHADGQRQDPPTRKPSLTCGPTGGGSQWLQEKLVGALWSVLGGV